MKLNKLIQTFLYVVTLAHASVQDTANKVLWEDNIEFGWATVSKEKIPDVER
jgi:hypothetical protein